MRAAHDDLTVEAGTDWVYAVRPLFLGQRTTVDQLQPGDWIEYVTDVWEVFTVAPDGTDRTRIRLGLGRFWEPSFSVPNTAEVIPLVRGTIQAAKARIALPDDPTRSPAPSFLELPASLIDSNTAVQLKLDAAGDEQTALVDWIDYWGGGPSGMTFPYDVLAQIGPPASTSLKWTRILEGTFTFIRSQTYPSGHIYDLSGAVTP